MSTGTNKERLITNNDLIDDLIETAQSLPEYLDTSDATATAGDIASGKTAYVDGEKITGTKEDKFVVPNGTKFKGSTALPNNLDTSNVTNMNNMFADCNNIREFPALDTSNVTDMSSMFSSCGALQQAPIHDTSKVTNMSTMFSRCSQLRSFSFTDTSKVTNMSGMFQYCGNLTELSELDMSNVENASNMFYYTGIVTFPQKNLSKLTNVQSMFQRSSITNFPQLNLSNVNRALLMFDGCSNLTDESLNNILATCITITKMSPKTLKEIGLSQAQATTCQTLSNWQGFVDAGWTTGY